MIALAKFQETQRLLALGNLSQRRISAIVGISRATVSAIAKGAYQLRDQRRRDREDHFLPQGPVSRCAGCGAMVQMPCLGCRMEKRKERERQILRAARRKAREAALGRLLHAVREANWRRDAQDGTRVA